jgi:hypothetical protein
VDDTKKVGTLEAKFVDKDKMKKIHESGDEGEDDDQEENTAKKEEKVVTTTQG